MTWSNTCPATDAAGNRCQLSPGHAGQHQANTPPAPTVTLAAAKAGPNLAAITVIIGGVIYGVSAFLPWITVTAAFVGTISRNGIDGGGDGFVSVLAGVAFVLVGIRAYTSEADVRTLVVLGSVVALAFAGLEYYNVSTRIEGLDPDIAGGAAVGNGIYAMFIGGVLTLVGGVRLKGSGVPDGGKPTEAVPWG